MKPTLYGTALMAGLTAAFFSDNPAISMLGLVICGGLIFAATMYPGDGLSAE